MVSDLVADRYRPLERYAVGGMATVWRARDEHTGEVVALKRIHPHLVADPAARARLDREAAALRLVDHPAVVRPRDVVDDPDDPALVMDFAEGRPLADRIAEAPLSPDEAVAIAGTIADALAVAHSHGIVHRDIKPANILVEDDGTLHLIDFGIASLDASGPAGLTDARSMVGTLRYAAPERLAGERASARSDVWALGAVLYEMLTGRPAVTGDDPAAVLAAGRLAGPDTSDLPPAIGAVIVRAMAADPAHRYPDAAAFRDALEALDAPVDPEAATAIVSLPIPGSHWRRPSVTREPRRTIALAAGLAAALLFIVALGRPTDPAAPGPAVAGAGQASLPVTSPVLPSLDATIAPSSGPGHGDGGGKGHGNGNGKGRD